MSRSKKIFFLLLLLISIFINISFFIPKIYAAEDDTGDSTVPASTIDQGSMTGKLDAFAGPQGANYPSPDKNNLRNIIVNAIRIVMALLGVLFLILIIISGFEWMTSGGNSTKIANAKKRLINAIIGLVIIICSYIILSFIMSLISGISKGNEFRPMTGNEYNDYYGF